MDVPNAVTVVSHGPVSRRDVQLSPIQTSFTRKQSQRLQRPRPIDTAVLEKPTNSTLPSQELPSLNRQKSKGGLLGLFSRSKSAKTQNVHQKLEMSRISEDAPGKVRLRGDSEQTRNTFYSLPANISSTRPIPSVTALPRRTSKIRLTPKLDKKDPQTKNLAAWDPPELFKAYPQAVKHARLRAPYLQAETILQLHDEKKSTSTDQIGAQDEMDVNMDSLVTDGFGKKREKDKKYKPMTTEISCDKWTERVYVLATSGYLLQYAGSGTFDRLPEKVMRLGKESAAFASDAIVGEYYVLQVSRTTNEEGVVSKESQKSVFKKLGFRNELKSTSSFLLVFNSADDMNAWLIAVRKEIEALGGRKYRPDVLVRSPTEQESRQLRERPSRRFLIKRDPYRFAEQTPDGNFGAKDSHAWPMLGNMDDSVITLRRPSMATEKSGESPSLSNGTTSTDQACLEGLRETPRMSYISTGEKTLSTSRASSPDPSPARAAFSPEHLIPQPIESSTTILATPQAQLSMARIVSSSNLPFIPVTNERQEPGLPRAVSMYGPLTLRKSSPPPPNYSVTSFSKRYSCATNSNLLTNPSIPTTPARPARGLSSPATSDKYRATKHRNLSLEEWPVSMTSHPNISGKKATEIPNVENARISSISLPSAKPPILRNQSRQPTDGRLSSLECSRGISLRHSVSSQSPSPHPPPTTALPALPQVQIHDHRRLSENMVKHRKAQRPISLQVHSDPFIRAKYHPLQSELQGTSEEDESFLSAPPTTIPKPRRAPPPPPIPIPKSNIQNRKSMPQMQHQAQFRPLPDFSLLPDISFLLDSENSAQGSFIEPWSSSDTGKGHQFKDTIIK